MFQILNDYEMNYSMPSLLEAAYSINTKKINLGKAAVMVSNDVENLHLPTKMAIKLSKESLDWMGKNNSVAGTKDRYDVRLNKLLKNTSFRMPQI